MANVTRHIGLSLGADICWPICFEEILRRLQLQIPWDGSTLGFDCERVTIEPFNLRQPVRYDLVIDRLTHWYHEPRVDQEGVVLNDTYVFNNPWSVQANEAHVVLRNDRSGSRCPRPGCCRRRRTSLRLTCRPR